MLFYGVKFGLMYLASTDDYQGKFVLGNRQDQNSLSMLVPIWQDLFCSNQPKTLTKSALHKIAINPQN